MPFSAKDKIAIFLCQKAIAIRANAIRERAAKRAPAGERERLVAANGIAVCLATFAMVIGEKSQKISGFKPNRIENRNDPYSENI